MRSEHEPTRYRGRARMENVILEDGSSILVDVVAADPAYVVGYYCDVRGFRVCTTLKRIDVRAIKLRIQVGDEERVELARALRFDQQSREYEAAL